MSCPQDWAAKIESGESRKDRVTICLDGAVLDKLDELAAAQNRSRSNMVESIIAERLG